MSPGARLAPLVLGSVALAIAVGACAASTSAQGGVAQDGGVGGNTPAGTGGTTSSADASSDGSFGSGGSTGTGGSVSPDGGAVMPGTGGLSGAGGAGGGAAEACSVTLTPISVPSFSDVEFGSEARLRIKGSVGNAGARATSWVWRVFFQNDPSMEIATVQIDESTIEFPIRLEGFYAIVAQASIGSTQCGKNVQVFAKAPCPRCFRLRVSPAGSDLGIPPQERRVDVGVPGVASLTLAAGIGVSVSPQDAAGHYLPAYVRVSGISAGLTVEGHTARGPVNAWLLPSAVYDVLVVPDGAWAPMLLSATTMVMNPLLMDQGTPVTGRLVDSAGTPVAGARVALRAGSRPSTIGISDVNGDFALLVRPGTLSAVIAPPPASGLPEAHVGGGASSPATSGILLAADVTGLDLSMAWNVVARTNLSVTARTSDGAGPASGARVRVESGETPAVGVLTAQSVGGTPVMLVTTGSVRLEASADDTGLARFPSLPVGAYQVTVIPRISSNDAALTTTSVTVPAGGLATTMRLARRVRLSGTLRALPDPSGVRVVARDQSTGVVAEVASAVAGDRGAYSLSVDPGRRYQLVADPPAGLGLARTFLGQPVAVGAVDTVAPDLTVAPAAPFTAFVRDPSGRGMAGAVVQVFCIASSAGCLDPTSALAEAVTRADGQLTVALPASIAAAP